MDQVTQRITIAPAAKFNEKDTSDGWMSATDFLEHWKNEKLQHNWDDDTVMKHVEAHMRGSAREWFNHKCLWMTQPGLDENLCFRRNWDAFADQFRKDYNIVHDTNAIDWPRILKQGPKEPLRRFIMRCVTHWRRVQDELQYDFGAAMLNNEYANNNPRAIGIEGNVWATPSMLHGDSGTQLAIHVAHTYHKGATDAMRKCHRKYIEIFVAYVVSAFFYRPATVVESARLKHELHSKNEWDLNTYLEKLYIFDNNEMAKTASRPVHAVAETEDTGIEDSPEVAAFKKAANSASGSSSTGPKPKCGFCQKAGHKKAKCPDRLKLKCKFCQIKGHLEKDCRKKQRSQAVNNVNEEADEVVSGVQHGRNLNGHGDW